MIANLLRRPFIAGLAFLALALAVLLAFEVGEATRPRIPDRPVRVAAATQAKLLPPLAATPPDQAYPETVARPLFTPTRRPAPTLATASAPAFNRGQFQLMGVIIAGNSKTAMLKEKASGKLHRVELGREVNGLKVSAIDRESVTLALGSETESVPLQVQKGGASPQAAAVAHGPFGQPGMPQSLAPVPPQPVAPPAAAPHPPPPTAQLAPGTAAFLGVPPAGTAPAGATPETSPPLSPEELLARRRARRAQPNQ